MLPTWVRDRDSGNIYLNDLKRYVKGQILVPRAAIQPLVTPAATLVAGTLNPGQSPAAIIESPEDAYSEIFTSVGLNDAADDPDVVARLSVQITDTAWRRRLMNRDILVSHVFGSNLQPFFLMKKIGLEPQQTLQFNFFNNSVAGVSNFDFMLESRKFQISSLGRDLVSAHIVDMRKKNIFLTPFWLTSDAPILLPAGGSVDAFFTASRDVCLVIFSIMRTAIVLGVPGAASDLQEVFTFDLFDSGTERPLNNQPISNNCGAGTSNFPYQLPTAIVVDPNTKMRVRFNSLVAAGGAPGDGNADIFFTFAGVACYVGSRGGLSADKALPAERSPLFTGAP